MIATHEETSIREAHASHREKAQQIIHAAMNEGRGNLLEHEALHICRLYGISAPEFALAENAQEAERCANNCGYPVALKIVSPDIIHKTEAGGVLIGLDTPTSVKSSFHEIIDKAKRYKQGVDIRGVLVQKMAPQGIETIIGSLKDPQFGQTVMFGLGGILVEMLEDVAFRVVPIDTQDALQMIHEVKGSALLKGYRNSPHANEEALADALLRVSALAMDFPEILSIDLNPTVAHSKGISVVDARVIFDKAVHAT